MLGLGQKLAVSGEGLPARLGKRAGIMDDAAMSLSAFTVTW